MIADHILFTLLRPRVRRHRLTIPNRRFLYSKRTFPGLLSHRNQLWARSASALLIVGSKQTFVPPGKHQPTVSHTHSLDTGAAWANFALQALGAGWHTRAMAGFDIDGARTTLRVPDHCRVEAAIAIGKLGDKSSLPESLQAQEAPIDADRRRRQRWRGSPRQQ